ncbi:hypothetical protein [Clostridium sp. BNL1100]|uniref:hypothetical protein n=1 Tax=Clostridium sp. BNL1100 TaxID=755731 RepID=UPI00024A74CC|nr:hypothetical protein [Clostridium sp. BNL1100]AEY65981.1 hypothetical protein Clo1100_1771 [Clostridium sp. BNL1100]
MQNFNCNDYMQMMNVPSQFSPMMEMPQDQLQAMFPRCYHIIMPEVGRMCDRMCAQYGPMFNPSRQMMDSMVDDIDNRVGADVDMDYQDFEGCENRQFVFDGFGGGRRRFRRDLITILLLRELLRRRRRPFFPFGFSGF